MPQKVYSHKELFGEDDEQKVYSHKELFGEDDVQPERGFLGDTVSHLARGFVGLSETTARAVETITGSETAKKAGDYLRDLPDQTKLLQPDESEVTGEEGAIKKGWNTTIESTPESLAIIPATIAGAEAGAVLGSFVPGLGPGLGTAAGGILGGVAGGGAALLTLFGAGTYGKQKSYVKERLEKERPELSKDQINTMSHENALAHMYSEVGGEGVGDLAAYLVFSSIPGGKLAYKGGKAILKELVNPNALKAITRGLLKDAPFEVGSEMGTSYFQNKADEKIGIASQSTLAAMGDAIIPALFMSTGMGVVVGGRSAWKRKQAYDRLNVGSADERMQYAKAVSRSLKEATSKDVAKKWYDTAVSYISSGDAIPLDSNVADLAANEGKPDAQEVRQQAPKPPPGPASKIVEQAQRAVKQDIRPTDEQTPVEAYQTPTDAIVQQGDNYQPVNADMTGGVANIEELPGNITAPQENIQGEVNINPQVNDVSEERKTLKLTPREYRTLEYYRDLKTKSPKEQQDAIGSASSPGAVKIVSRLEEKGLIKKEDNGGYTPIPVGGQPFTMQEVTNESKRFSEQSTGVRPISTNTDTRGQGNNSKPKKVQGITEKENNNNAKKVQGVEEENRSGNVREDKKGILEENLTADEQSFLSSLAKGRVIPNEKNKPIYDSLVDKGLAETDGKSYGISQQETQAEATGQVTKNDARRPDGSNGALPVGTDAGKKSSNKGDKTTSKTDKKSKLAEQIDEQIPPPITKQPVKPGVVAVKKLVKSGDKSGGASQRAVTEKTTNANSDQESSPKTAKKGQNRKKNAVNDRNQELNTEKMSKSGDKKSQLDENLDINNTQKGKNEPTQKANSKKTRTQKAAPKSEATQAQKTKVTPDKVEGSASKPGTAEKNSAKAETKYSKSTLPVEKQANVKQEIVSEKGRPFLNRLLRNDLVEIVNPVEGEKVLTKLTKPDIKYSADGQRIEGFTARDPRTGKTKSWIIEGNVKKGEAHKLMLHETSSHLMLEGKFKGKDWDNIVSQFHRFADKNSVTGKAIRAAKARVPKSTKAEHVDQEMIAYYMGDSANRDQSLYRKVVAYIKEKLVELGFSAKMFTPADIEVIAKRLLARAYSPDGNSKSLFRSETGPQWYSRLQRLVEDFDVKRQPASAWVNTFNSWKKKKLPPALQEELEWSGVLDILKGLGKQKITKGDVLNLFERGKVDVRVETLSGGQQMSLEQAARQVFEEEWYSNAYDDWMYAAIEEETGIAWDKENHIVWDSLEDTKEEYIANNDGDVEEAFSDFERDVSDLNWRDGVFSDDDLSAFKNEAMQDALGEATIDNPRIANLIEDSADENENGTQYEQNTLPGGENYKEILVSVPNVGGQYTPTHFGNTKNLVTHVRVDDRTEKTGKDTSFINEIQSDWGNEARSKGVKALPPNASVEDKIEFLKKEGWSLSETSIDPSKPSVEESNQGYQARHYGTMGPVKKTKSEAWKAAAILAEAGKVLNAPFIKSDTAWSMLGFKTALRDAVENDKKYLAWPSTPKQIYEIEGWGEVIEEDGRYKNRDGVGDVTAIVNRYLKDLPRNVDRFLKSQMSIKDMKTEKISLYGGEEVNAVEISDEIRSSVLGGGVPLFSRQKLSKKANLKEWFGKSKVKQFVYHGSSTFGKGDNFTFDNSRETNTTSPMRGLGYFFAEEESEARGYAGADGQTQKIILRIENPLEVNSWEIPTFEGTAEAKAYSKRKELDGYDGIHIKDEGHWITFKPNQSKSATKNIGSYSRSNDDIRYSVAAAKALDDSIVESIPIVREKIKPADMSIAEKILSTAEYIFKRSGATKRMFQAQLDRRDDKYQLEEKILQKFVPIMEQAKKKFKSAYKKANDYLVYVDKTGKAFRVKRDNIWAVFDPAGNLVGYTQTNEEAYKLANKQVKPYRVKSGNKDIDYRDFKKEKQERFHVQDQKGKTVKTFETEKDAISYAVESEQNFLEKEGMPVKARKLVREFREMTNRAFDEQVADYRRILREAAEAGLDEPTVPTVDESKRWALYDKSGVRVGEFASEIEARQAGGKSHKIKKMQDSEIKKEMKLSDLIAQMGDLRGAYFPRQRESGAVILRAKKDGEDPIMKKYDFYLTKDEVADSETGEVRKKAISGWLKKRFNQLSGHVPYVETLEKEARRLHKLGYEVTAERDSSTPESVFDAVKLVSSVNDLLNEAVRSAKKEGKSVAAENINKILNANLADIFKGRGYLSSRISRSENYVKGFEEDMLLAGTQYARGLAAGFAKRNAAQKMVLAITGRDKTWNDFKAKNKDASWQEYQAEVDKRRLDPNKQPKLHKEATEWMREVLRNDEQVDRIMGTIKGLAVIKFLGFRVSSALINATNMVQAVPATIASHSGGKIADALKAVTNASVQYGKYITGKGGLSKADREIFMEISNRGWDDAQFNTENAAVLQSKVGQKWNTFNEYAMKLFGVVEKANRSTTIFAAYKEILKNTNLEGEKALLKAKDVSDRAHGIYGKATMPAWTRGAANPLKLTYTFQKFMHNYLLNMTEMGLKGDHGAAAYMLLSPAVLAGAGATLATPALSALAGVLGVGGDDPEEAFYKWAGDTFGSDRFARHGLAGLAGVNLKGSLQMNNPMPRTLSELFGAPQAIFTDTKKGFKHMLAGEFMKGGEAMLPTAFGSMLKSTREATEGVSTGSYSPVFYGNEPIKADGLDATLRFLSFNPARISGIREMQWHEKKVAKKFQERRKRINTLIKRYFLYKKGSLPEIYKEIRRYNDLVRGSGRRDLTLINPRKQFRSIIKRSRRGSKVERMRGN